MKATVWFYSDPHFNHKNILKYCPRPYADLVEMERELIKNYNSVVKPFDVVYWLGDCFFCGTMKAKEILAKMNGKKILIRGNHDRNAEKMKEIGFDEVYDKLEIELDGIKLKLCHFPFRPDTADIDPKVLARLQQLKGEARASGNDSKQFFTDAAAQFLDTGILTKEQFDRLTSYDMRFWSRRYEEDGSTLLCGHVHNSWKTKSTMINCGVDVWDMKPVGWPQIKELINGR